MIERRNNLLFKARNLDMQDLSLKQQCIDARRDTRNAIVIAKSKWVRHIAKQVERMNFNPKDAWKAIKLLKDGHTSHHTKYKLMIFRMENGSLTIDEKDRAKGLASFFKEVCNQKVSIDQEYIKLIIKKSILYEIAGMIMHNEINMCIFKLAQHKALGK